MNNLVFIFALIGMVTHGLGQVKKQFFIDSPEKTTKVDFHLGNRAGSCKIVPSWNESAVTIYSNREEGEYKHTLDQHFSDGTAYIDLQLKPNETEGWARTVSQEIFNKKKGKDGFWKVYLSKSLPYDLNLEFGLGNALVDLSGMAIEHLRINTGGASVKVNFDDEEPNPVVMESFHVHVDMGELLVNKITKARSKKIIAKVSFGNMRLDFASAPDMDMEVIGSVGAGKLMIVLPPDSVPVKAIINDSWLCSTSIGGLKQNSRGEYVNEAYKKSSKNAVTFILDVSVGKIMFRPHQ